MAKDITLNEIMRFKTYLKDKTVFLLLLVLAMVVAALIMLVYKVEILVSIAVCALFFVAAFTGLIWDYVSRRRFFQELEKGTHNSSKAYYITEFIDRPIFLEGKLVYDCLERATKDMNDRIAQYRLASSEYQEYVETWIHEVKTPLAASRLIIDNYHAASLHSLEHELDRTEAYLEQALYYARSTAVEKDYALKKVNLEVLVKNAVKKYSRTLIEKDIVPQFEELNYFVYTDPKWLDFVLGQIIDNSAKYPKTRSQEHVPQLSFSAKYLETGFDGGKVILLITDNGLGIPAHDTSRVFEKGFTGENGRTHAQSTGIGLYLCKKLCTQMKLGIDLCSTQGEGTRVVVTFPLNKMYFLE